MSVRESSEDNVRAYAEKYQLDYTIAADVTGAVYDLYRLNGIPTSFFIGPEGAIHAIVNGPLTEASARGQVEALLPAPSPSAPSLPRRQRRPDASAATPGRGRWGRCTTDRRSGINAGSAVVRHPAV